MDRARMSEDSMEKIMVKNAEETGIERDPVCIMEKDYSTTQSAER